ncbi:pregnancy-specific beta-1-glycoprotein 1-like [Gigantopelta aegis]|uniref:pregnancy-specific beta-1-glycoprotein 1-like n=1 Tax=Gigantopelta aegis TaxID=1735272 RepID=UPI001B88B35C|nr:pregnancy-specific beta-1-glycoprotein 1-like [Gigantopelta aegis]
MSQKESMMGSTSTVQPGTVRWGNNDEVTSNKIRLVVQYGPLKTDINFDPAEVAYTVGETGSLTVNCSVDCKPSCIYTWTYLERGIATGSRLSLTHITEQDAGYYKCTARNPGSGITADKYFKLHVESKWSKAVVENMYEQLCYLC